MLKKIEVKGNIYIAGVYAFRDKLNGKYLYIGSSVEVNDAFSRHKHYLKNGEYTNSNKKVLQDEYNKGNLMFEVIHTSTHKRVWRMSKNEKFYLQLALGVLEKFYIRLLEEQVCNTQRSVTKHSSNRDANSTNKRRLVNLGEKNPNCKYDRKMIEEIIWLKNNTKCTLEQIQELIKQQYKITISTKYLYQIGIWKWRWVEGNYPEWLKDIS